MSRPAAARLAGTSAAETIWIAATLVFTSPPSWTRIARADLPRLDSELRHPGVAPAAGDRVVEGENMAERILEDLLRDRGGNGEQRVDQRDHGRGRIAKARDHAHAHVLRLLREVDLPRHLHLRRGPAHAEVFDRHHARR